MPIISSSIVVDAPVATTFEVSNRIDRWPTMIPEYLEAEILRREGRKIWFRLTNADGASWVSWRMLYPPYLAYAERHEPMAPFTFNQITWVYHALPGNRTFMTWEMFFELPEDSEARADELEQHMTEHTKANQAMMKDHIESLDVLPETTATRGRPGRTETGEERG